jgi:hypothetical protein
MTRRDLEPLLLTLESTPMLLARAARRIPRAKAGKCPRHGGFSLVEHVWHLADLEREGYGARIQRLLTESEPFLPNFEGNRIARERGYARRELTEGLAAFAEARRANLRMLRGISGATWDRAGSQESVGRVTLADLPRMMRDHDGEHTREIRDLLEELRTGRPAAVAARESAVA